MLGEQRLLRPDEQVFEAILAGWRDQQLCRNFGEATVRRQLKGLLAVSVKGKARPPRPGAY